MTSEKASVFLAVMVWCTAMLQHSMMKAINAELRKSSTWFITDHDDKR